MRYYLYSCLLFICCSGCTKLWIKHEDNSREEPQRVSIRESTVVSPEKKSSTDTKEIAQQKVPVIIIDPGHGGKDEGAKGENGLKEKDYTLKVALLLEEKLKGLPVKVKLTRRKDVFYTLEERVAFANQEQGDLFISIHGNASKGRKGSGFSVYYLDNTDDKASKLLAERENTFISHEPYAGDLEFIISDLIQTGKLKNSVKLSSELYGSVLKKFTKKNKRTKFLGVQKAPFYVLVGTHMPGALAEIFFIDSPVDSKIIADKSFYKDITDALLTGIRRYLKI